jgi:hypothetical protein
MVLMTSNRKLVSVLVSRFRDDLLTILSEDKVEETALAHKHCKSKKETLARNVDVGVAPRVFRATSFGSAAVLSFFQGGCYRMCPGIHINGRVSSILKEKWEQVGRSFVSEFECVFLLRRKMFYNLSLYMKKWCVRTFISISSTCKW